jgi:hypothetical protein
MVNHARGSARLAHSATRGQLWYKYIHMEDAQPVGSAPPPLPSDSVLAPQRNSARMMPYQGLCAMWASALGILRSSTMQCIIARPDRHGHSYYPNTRRLVAKVTVVY